MTTVPTSRVTITREGDHFRVVAHNVIGQVIQNRRSPQFSTIAMRRTWAIQQAERLAEDHYLRFDHEITEG